MLLVDPERRLSLRGVAKHRWLNSHTDPGGGGNGSYLHSRSVTTFIVFVKSDILVLDPGLYYYAFIRDRE